MNITVTKRDGSREPFNANRINRSIERAAVGLLDPIAKVTQVATDTHVTLYDGITEQELDMATINAAVQNIKEDVDYDKIATRLLLKITYKQVLGDYKDAQELAALHKNNFPAHVRKFVADKIFDVRMEKNFDLERLAAALKIERDEIFIYSGLDSLMHRYSVKDKFQKPAETPQYFFMRIAMGMAYNEKDATDQAIKFYEKMSKHEYIAGGSTNIYGGTATPSVSNCFLLEIHDDMNHISKSVADVMLLSKASGGIGASITKLRATGSPLSSNNTTSSGPTPFAKIIDTAIRAIQRGGKKKGALCFYMENWHYDFPEFVEWKHNAGDDYMRMRTADTAVFLSDEFMKRVEEKQDWYMFDPKETADLNELYGKAFSVRYNEYIKMAEEGKLRMWKKVPATEQYRAILVALQTTSHPWLVWKDTINLRALNNNTGTIHMSNLCTEICLPQDKNNIAVCNLISVNIAGHLAKKQIDWQRLEESVRMAVRQLDNLIDINVLPVPEAANSDKQNRAIGVGVMGFSDAIEQLGIPYDSPHAYDFADKIFEFVSYMAIDESANLAQERGSYPNFAGSEWSKGRVPVDTIAKLEEERGMQLDIDKKSKQNWLDWDMLRAKVKQGMRNATLMAVAPNANIGLVAGTTPGIDPRFAQVFSRNKISGKYLDINHNLVTELKNLNLWDLVKSKIIELQGDISSIEEIPPHIRAMYKTSFSVSPYAFIEVAARAQKWVDQALSRNMYLEDRDIDRTMDIYTTAWRKGVKSTYYLHMKPRHTAEQSTVAVNKSAKLGKTGFAAAFKKEEPVAVTASAESFGVSKEETVVEGNVETADTKVTTPIAAVTPVQTVTPVQPITSKAIFSNVQTAMPITAEKPKIEAVKTESVQPVQPVQEVKQMPIPQPNASAEASVGKHYKERIVDGKVYRIHMPSDPQMDFMCDDCQ